MSIRVAVPVLVPKPEPVPQRVLERVPMQVSRADFGIARPILRPLTSSAIRTMDAVRRRLMALPWQVLQAARLLNSGGGDSSPDTEERKRARSELDQLCEALAELVVPMSFDDRGLAVRNLLAQILMEESFRRQPAHTSSRGASPGQPQLRNDAQGHEFAPAPEEDGEMECGTSVQSNRIADPDVTHFSGVGPGEASPLKFDAEGREFFPTTGHRLELGAGTNISLGEFDRDYVDDSYCGHSDELLQRQLEDLERGFEGFVIDAESDNDGERHRERDGRQPG
jgi:hypothetical protein